MADELTRETLNRLALSYGGKVGLGCTKHPNVGTTALYQDGSVRILCRDCGFEVVRVKAASKEEAAPKVVYLREQEGSVTELFPTLDDAMTVGETKTEDDWRCEKKGDDGLCTEWLICPEFEDNVRVTQVTVP
jgi:hypothetical protein